MLGFQVITPGLIPTTVPAGRKVSLSRLKPSAGTFRSRLNGMPGTYLSASESTAFRYGRSLICSNKSSMILRVLSQAKHDLTQSPCSRVATSKDIGKKPIDDLKVVNLFILTEIFQEARRQVCLRSGFFLHRMRPSIYYCFLRMEDRDLERFWSNAHNRILVHIDYFWKLQLDYQCLAPRGGSLACSRRSTDR
ncbi:hypothetical protein KC318_g5 [Hortaea werneckii]|nr:hypothetical protein KC334_g5 [Hortaea werneckii]KAI7028385.1 hypothetical protein KC355_g5 [Hortaea werneckii]KAI7676803.1 hypothetical protein KC318_g5 [Hortaea werneckii]